MRTEGYPEQARVEQGYWTKQLATDEIDSPRSLNDATPAEWDQASKITNSDGSEYSMSPEWVALQNRVDQASKAAMSCAATCSNGIAGAVDKNSILKNCPKPDLSACNVQIGGSHYRDMEIQPIEFITANKLGWCEGHVVKYVSRHASKGGKQDLEKAKHYIDMLIGEVYDA